jgi:hypothetical protein
VEQENGAKNGERRVRGEPTKSKQKTKEKQTKHCID